MKLFYISRTGILWWSLKDVDGEQLMGTGKHSSNPSLNAKEISHSLI
jgi:hypothetical protein